MGIGSGQFVNFLGAIVGGASTTYIFLKSKEKPDADQRVDRNPKSTDERIDQIAAETLPSSDEPSKSK